MPPQSSPAQTTRLRPGDGQVWQVTDDSRIARWITAPTSGPWSHTSGPPIWPDHPQPHWSEKFGTLRWEVTAANQPAADPTGQAVSFTSLAG